jgi:hypothetical protein
MMVVAVETNPAECRRLIISDRDQIMARLHAGGVRATIIGVMDECSSRMISALQDRRRHLGVALSNVQGELFAQASYALRPALMGPDGVAPFIVIGCSRDKQAQPAPAGELYLSSRFRSSLSLAHTLGAPHTILSGKHGIVAPETVLEPYDLNVADLSDAGQRSWAGHVLEQLRACAGGRRITLLAAPEYTLPLIELNQENDAPLDLEAPWMALERPDVSGWLVEADRMAARIRDLRLFYAWTDEQRQRGRVFPFRALAAQVVPTRGVYIILDRREPNFLGVQPRIVRIGTHAVSRGSKATLRGRLRNHLGPANEIGNHRGSIFRLHIGRAMLDAGEGRHRLPSWGEGQDAGAHIRAAESDHELAVSRYLQELEVALIAINDEAAKSSLRASVEAQLIALCSEGLRTIDCPTPDWLGLKSPVASIRKSGLWNIRGVGEKYDPAGAGSIASIIGA